MDLRIITALWCVPHPLDFSSGTTGTNASCICTCLSCLLTPVCLLKTEFVTRSHWLGSFHSSDSVSLIPLQTVHSATPVTLPLCLWQGKGKPFCHPPTATWVSTMVKKHCCLPSTAQGQQLYHRSGEGERKSAPLSSLWPGRGWKVSSRHIAQEECYYHAKPPMSWLHVPVAVHNRDAFLDWLVVLLLQRRLAGRHFMLQTIDK